MLCRAVYLMQTSGSKRGLPEVDKVVALLQDTQEQQLLAESLETRGDIQSLLGEQAKAMLDFQRARAAYRGAGIDREVEPLMLSMAVAYRRMGDWPQAERYFRQAVARMEERPICASDRFRSSVFVPSRWARSACMRRPASGVLSW